MITVDGQIFVSYRDGSDFGVLATDPDTKADWTYQGLDLRSPVKKPIKITDWTTAEVYCQPLVDGTSIQFWYKVDKDGDFVRATMQDGFPSFQAPGEKKAVFLLATAGDIFEPQVVGIHSGNNSPVVNRIKVYFN